MGYSIKQVAEISGVSAPTLRWFDTAGLFSKIKHDAKGLRTYEEDDILLLQQILLLKELGADIGTMRNRLQGVKFNHKKTLTSLKRDFQEKIRNFSEIIKLIERTLMRIDRKDFTIDQNLFFGIHPHFGESNERFDTSDYQPFVPISKREAECLSLSLAGKTARQIAETLGLSVRTIEHYMDNIKSKYGCKDKSELFEKVQMGMRFKLDVFSGSGNPSDCDPSSN